jgi:outer membrane protein assembly factor BamD
MYIKGFGNILFGLITVLLLGSCAGEFRKIQKSTDWRVKYDAAMEYYENEDYYRASILFEEVLPIMLGTPEAERAQFYFAYSHYYQGNRLLSAHYFKSFFDTYRRSSLAEEALFMHAFSLYRESPKYNLDQTSTIEAINAMQSFLNIFPYSERRDEANEIIDQMQAKLEMKAYEKAKQYYRLQNLHAAVVAFENFQKSYPDSDMVEEAAYLIVDAQYRYAAQSIPSRQRERFMQAVQYYEYFIDNFPNSRYVRDAEKLYEQTINALAGLRSDNNSNIVLN